MLAFIKTILAEGNMVKIYLASGETAILTEIDGENEGVLFGSHNHGDQKVRYAINLNQIAAIREHW